MHLRTLFFAALLGSAPFGCTDSDTPSASAAGNERPNLKTAFADDFRVGAALNAATVEGRNPMVAELVAREYNTITPENVMKWERIHPARDTFRWDTADAFVAYGEHHDMFMVGHTLVWHSQLSDYVKEIKDPDELRAAMKEHIDAVAGRYRGRVQAWDVVNEALNKDGTLRETVFYEVLGEDYLTDAFKMAAEAAGPDTKLYYNDYSMWREEKREGAIRIIQKIRANGGRVDGVGMQAHYSLKGPSIDTIEKSILAFAAAGIPVMMTELDVTVLPNPKRLAGADVNQDFKNAPGMNPYTGGLPDSMQQVLAQRYQEVFKLYLRHRDKIDRVTFWGVADHDSWLNGFPVKGRTNYPLLFDRAYRPKPAYHRLLGLKQPQTGGSYNYQTQANEVPKE